MGCSISRANTQGWSVRTLDIPLRGVFFRTNHQQLFIAVGSGAENSTCRTCRSVRTVGEKDVRVSPTYSPRIQPHRELRESNDTSAHTHPHTRHTLRPCVGAQLIRRTDPIHLSEEVHIVECKRRQRQHMLRFPTPLRQSRHPATSPSPLPSPTHQCTNARVEHCK